ncbi:MAG: PAS domain S-box protein [Smithellaceae bacterium]
MKESSRTKSELLAEISILKQKNKKLEKSEANFKRVEETLRESEEVFHLLFEQSGYAALLIEDGRYIDCNKAALKMLGCSSKSALISLTPSDISPEKQPDGKLSSEKAARMLEKAFNDGSNHFDWIHKKLDGTRIYLDVVLTPITIKGRKLIYTVWRDVTAQKKAEKAFKKSERRLADIIDFLPDATMAIDMKGKLIIWNRANEEMTGLCKNDVLGREHHIAMVPFYGERRGYLLDLIESRDKDIESKYQYVQRKGNVIYGEAFAPALNGGKGAYLWGIAAPLYDPDGNRVGAIESIRDITDSKLAEQALKKSEERFRMLVDHAPSGISLINENDSFEYINPRFTEIFGYTLADIVNKQTWLEKVNPDLDDKAQTKVSADGDFIKGISKDRSGERTVKIRCKDKKEKIINTRTRVLDDGRQLIFYEDITEQRGIEAQLRQANKIEAIGTLAAGIAHDFNNILGGMIGYTEMSLLHIGTGNSLLKQYLEQIRSGIQRATDLVKQILTFSRQTNQEMRPIRVIPILKETLKLIRAAIPSYIEIIDNIEVDRDLILADPTRIHQVLMNLCANAAHAMRKKGGVLRVEITNLYLDESNNISADIKAGWHLRITVGDTGPGIDATVIDRIFDPFFTTKNPGEGTGLGLAVVHGIVKTHRGTIIVRSLPDRGTTFEIYLPLIEEKDDITNNDPEKTYVGGKERIIFVDDEETMTRVGDEMLTKMGYNVLATTSSVAALEAFRLQPEHFDIVITDQIMPDMTGTVMAAELLKIRPNLPIILCTGFSEIATSARLKTIGISGFIMKPFTMATLDATIRKVLPRKT